MSKKIVIIILLLLSITFSLHIKVSKEKPIINSINTIFNNKNGKTKVIDPIGKLEIQKINLKKYLYAQNSPLNNIEKNVTIIKETISKSENGLIILAAHSGDSDKSYFNDLDKLTIGDYINLTYKGKEYLYIVTNIFEQEKKGYINLNIKDANQLFLTTCSKTPNKQLIIETKKIVLTN